MILKLQLYFEYYIPQYPVCIVSYKVIILKLNTKKIFTFPDIYATYYVLMHYKIFRACYVTSLPYGISLNLINGLTHNSVSKL